jgi:hypothetical protein
MKNSMWRMTMKNDEDDEFDRVLRESGYRTIGVYHKPMTDKELDNELRNGALEEVALEFEKMRNGGDTTASFAIYVRSMKR